jgi:GNAT superfamily N-acetyltransferase
MTEYPDIKFRRLTAPIDHVTAWRIESFLLKIFEYGDYSFRSALLGRFSSTLVCSFFIAETTQMLLAVAVCLHSRTQNADAIIGPVAVEPRHRRKGLGKAILTRAIEHLTCCNIRYVYLAVSNENPARTLYEKFGFTTYNGIVMRKVFTESDRISDQTGTDGQKEIIRRMVWGDYPGVSALMASPASMYAFDFSRGIFSERYVPCNRFLNVFPNMMEHFTKYGGFANVIVSPLSYSIVAIAHIQRMPGPLQDHMAVLDFFVNDDFINRTSKLVTATIEQAKSLSLETIRIYCPAADHLKRRIIESFEPKIETRMRKHLKINNCFQDVFVYRLELANIVN